MTAISIEPARPADLPDIEQLLVASHLPVEGVAGHLPTALVARAGQAVIGCAALELYPPAALLRSVAVAAAWQGQGVGQQLTAAALSLARQHGLTHLYLLTETATGYFPKFGFRPVNRDRVPAAVQQSPEFTSLCPASAQAMALHLDGPING